MQETNDQKNKFIFTDSFRTKDILWEAYTGFIDAYYDYKMLESIGRKDPITIATMNKYAHYFYDEIEVFLDDFKKEIKTLDNIKKIFAQQKLLEENFHDIRKFFGTFMTISGIKNIVKEKEYAGKSIEDNR